MATLCFAAVAIEHVDILRTASWVRLRHDSFHGPYAVGPPFLLGVALSGLAVMSFRYRGLGSALRGVTLLTSVCLALWRIGDAVWLTLVALANGWSAVDVGMLIAKWLLALIFAFCGYTLWQCWRASNHRWSGP
jgi:hypothetical protein